MVSIFASFNTNLFDTNTKLCTNSIFSQHRSADSAWRAQRFPAGSNLRKSMKDKKFRRLSNP